MLQVLSIFLILIFASNPTNADFRPEPTSSAPTEWSSHEESAICNEGNPLCYYPPLPPRQINDFGLWQELRPLCHYFAVINSLEHHFARHGFSVRLDAKNFIADGSVLIPEYFWPDSLSDAYTGLSHRKSYPIDIKKYSNINFESFRSYKVTRNDRTFSTPKNGPPYSNYIPFNEIKSLLWDHAVIMSIHSCFVWELIDEPTGLLKKPFSEEDFYRVCSSKSVLKENKHDTALVGFDDRLYGGRGAFITLNAWQTTRQYTEQVALEKKGASFKNNFKKYPLAHYIALPYDYVKLCYRLSSPHFPHELGVGHVFIYSVLNMPGYFQTYQTEETKNNILFLPYSCNRNRIEPFLEGLKTLNQEITSHEHTDKKKYRMLRVELRNRIKEELTLNRASSHFKIAVLNDHTLSKFLGQEMNDIYCDYHQGEGLFPSLETQRQIEENKELFQAESMVYFLKDEDSFLSILLLYSTLL